ncbi:MAG: V-type ATP synthase subunit E family protein [Thermoprotei archaeon]
MSAEAILREVQEKLKRQVAELESEYTQKMDEARRSTDAEVARLKEEAEKQAKLLAEKERVKILGSARLQAKRIVAGAKQTYVERGVENMLKALQKYSSGEEYKKFLGRMLEYARGRLGKDLSVRCRPKDKGVFEKLGVKVSASDLDSVGGAIFSSADGSLELDLRFEELIRLRGEELRSAIMGLAEGGN